jgi:uncharacterized Fe-S radical SAM superfamily protein PflX
MLVHSLLGFFFLLHQWTYILAETTGEESEDPPSGEMCFPYCTLRSAFCRTYQISHQSEWGGLLTVSNILPTR